ncbi:hypothetical protein [Sinobacterium norvegicum]|uniref:hypothetical protein n=1 Tax=Sinobacterium norvegicum TaxID=1641715 RepID=UPI001F1701ED|nr:hypothetical protein [Sinobacterium norvegicum]
MSNFLRDSWRFFENNFAALAWIILPIAIPLEIIMALLSNTMADDSQAGLQILLIVVSLAASAIYGAATIIYVDAAVGGEKVTPLQSWWAAKDIWAAYLLLSVLAMVVIVLGLSLLIVPGIYFAGKYAFAGFELVLNGQKPLESLQLSWTKTTGLMPCIIGGGLIISALLYLPYFGIAELLDTDAPAFIVFEALFNIVYALFSSLYTIFAYRVYIDARQAAHPKD